MNPGLSALALQPASSDDASSTGKFAVPAKWALMSCGMAYSSERHELRD
jgi:hypothetical protein